MKLEVRGIKQFAKRVEARRGDMETCRGRAFSLIFFEPLTFNYH